MKKKKPYKKKGWSKTEIIAVIALIIDTIFRILDRVLN